MKKTIVLLFFSMQLFAFEPHTITYSLVLNGINLAQETRDLTKENEVYTYNAKAKTIGLAKFFKDYKVDAKSNFIINNLGVRSLNYQILEKDNNDTKKDLKADFSTNDDGAIDPLSLFLALSYDLKNKPDKSKFSYKVNNGEKTKEHNYQKIGEQTIKINDKPLNVIEVIRIGEKNKKLKAFFSPNHQYLPVLIEKDNKNKSYVYELINIKLEDDK